MVRNVQATTTSGLRKNRVTQKTRLRVVRGELDADAIIIDDDDERNRVVASQGVDAEDANEHHLQAVLNDSNHKRNAHIPTPDAAGLVAGYDALYHSGKYAPPTTHLRFSETVEECIDGGLAGGFAYFLDERDAEWLYKNNQEARGEGTSASAAEDVAAVNGTRGGRTRTRGKQEPAPVVIGDDEFELVMGLFEKFTDDKFPYLHLAPDNFPPFADFHPSFAAPLPPATFASYIVPTSIPPPARLVLVAHAVYAHWRARKAERAALRIVPQLDYDDTHESSYICFRRRDAKPVRRTRASSSAYTDKLARLRAELHMGLDIAKMVREREALKTDAAAAAQGLWRARCQLVEEWRAGDGKVPGMGIDEALLFDRERVAKKPKLEGPSRILLGLNRRPQSTPGSAPPSPLTAHLDSAALSAQGYVAVQSAVNERHRTVQANVEREMASLRARDSAWEDVLDLPYQAAPVPQPEKLFRACEPEGLDVAPRARPSAVSDTPGPVQQRTPRALRLRTGRGGRLHLDRRLHASPAHARRDEGRGQGMYWAHESLYDTEPASLGKRTRTEYDADEEQGRMRKRARADEEQEGICFDYGRGGVGLVGPAEWEKGSDVECVEETVVQSDGGGTGAEAREDRDGDDAERARRVVERWRYDADGGREDDARILVDDFQPKFLRTLVTLLDAADHDALMPDAEALAPPLIPDAAPRPGAEAERAHRPPPLVFHSPPAPVPIITPPLPLAQPLRMDEPIRRIARQTPSVSPTAPAAHAAPKPAPAPYTNGSGATVRVSSPVRPPGPLALHPGHGLNAQQYATLRNVFAEPAAGAQMPGSLGLKLPPARGAHTPGPPRANAHLMTPHTPGRASPLAHHPHHPHHPHHHHAPHLQQVVGGADGYA